MLSARPPSISMLRFRLIRALLAACSLVQVPGSELRVDPVLQGGIAPVERPVTRNCATL